jgi:hypothetical protein
MEEQGVPSRGQCGAPAAYYLAVEANPDYRDRQRELGNATARRMSFGTAALAVDGPVTPLRRCRAWARAPQPWFSGCTSANTPPLPFPREMIQKVQLWYAKERSFVTQSYKIRPLRRFVLEDTSTVWLT